MLEAVRTLYLKTMLLERYVRATPRSALLTLRQGCLPLGSQSNLDYLVLIGIKRQRNH